jgi:hypothetical protein
MTPYSFQSRALPIKNFSRKVGPTSLENSIPKRLYIPFGIIGETLILGTQVFVLIISC